MNSNGIRIGPIVYLVPAKNVLYSLKCHNFKSLLIFFKMFYFNVHLNTNWFFMTVFNTFENSVNNPKKWRPVLFLLSRFSIDDNLQASWRSTCNTVSKIIFGNTKSSCLEHCSSDFFFLQRIILNTLYDILDLSRRKEKQKIFKLFTVCFTSKFLDQVTWLFLVLQISLLLLNTKYFENHYKITYCC